MNCFVYISRGRGKRTVLCDRVIRSFHVLHFVQHVRWRVGEGSEVEVRNHWEGNGIERDLGRKGEEVGRK